MPPLFFYRVCYWFRLHVMKQDDYFWVNFYHFWIENGLLEAAGAVLKICLSPKSNHHRDIRETLCKYSRGQFHQHFTHSFFIRKQIVQLYSSYKPKTHHCNFWRPKFCTKNVRVNCWWNWHQTSSVAQLSRILPSIICHTTLQGIFTLVGLFARDKWFSLPFTRSTNYYPPFNALPNRILGRVNLESII